MGKCIGAPLYAGKGSIRYTRSLTRIPVRTASRSYEVLVERGLLRSASACLQEVIPPHSRVFLVSSAPILKLWGDLAERELRPGRTAARGAGNGRWRDVQATECGREISRKDGEPGRGPAVGRDRPGRRRGRRCRRIPRFHLHAGIPVIQVPTTLVAQVDSAIGGKTGVNLVSGKNLDRNVSSAAGGAGRSRCALDAA